MDKARFVDFVRGPDKRDKNPNFRRLTTKPSFGDIVCAGAFIIALFALSLSIVFAIVNAYTQQYHWLLPFVSVVSSLVVALATKALISLPTYEHVQLTIEDLRAYTGQHVYIHFLNNVTGYEDGWYPFYGATEEFVRINGARPELCVAPYEQYGKGWIAYSQQPAENRKETHLNEHT